MKLVARMILSLAGSSLVILLAAAPGWAQSYSHARIVRMSFVEGTVTLQRPDLTDWGTASVNTPIQEGFKVSTAENSFAEVEFENASTVRLGQLSLIEFSQLALMPSGSKVNRVTLHQGYATFNFIRQADDVNEVKTRDTTLTPAGGSTTMFRIDLDAEAMRVEVFKGSLEVSSPYGSETLTKEMVAELRPGADQPLMISQGITKDAWDEWVEQRQGQTALAPANSGRGFYPSGIASDFYGWNDLGLFGSWFYFPGFGYGWSPYVSSGWIPYSFGRWCWYPGFGYTWISGEPWGWLPYHFGGWSFVPGAGWCWFPDSFNAWSPALVSWYQGPGWIGWGPQAPQGNGLLAGGGQNNCLRGSGCVTAVSLNNFQNGRPVAPGNTLPVDLSAGRPIPLPEIPPTRLGMLPGMPVPQVAAVQSGSRPGGTNAPVPGTSSAVRAPSISPSGNALVNSGAVSPQTGIAYDPQSGRFVNSPGVAPALRPTTDSAASGNSTATGVTQAGTALTTAAEAGGADEQQGASASSPAPAPSPASQGVREQPSGRVAPSSNPSGGAAPKRHWFHLFSPSSDRAAPSSSGGSTGAGSGSRSSTSSSGWSGGSIGGGRSGGGGTSGGGGGGSGGAASHGGGSRH